MLVNYDPALRPRTARTPGRDNALRQVSRRKENERQATFMAVRKLDKCHLGRGRKGRETSSEHAQTQEHEFCV